MEEKLDSIGEGKIDWIKVMNDFYEPFKKELADAKENMRNIKRMEEPTDIECPKCKEHTMVIKWGKNGSFLGCSGYPDCKTTLPFRRENGEIVIEEPPKTDVKCLLCGSDMAVKRGKYGNFLGCSKYPDCKGTQAITLGIPCPKEACSGEVTEKRSKRGKLFYGCNKYPNCDFVSWNKPVMQPCETCGSKYMEEKMTKNGAVLICPECKLKK